MIHSVFHTTERLKIHALEKDMDTTKEVVVFLHGNASSSVFWKEIMEKLPDTYRAIAPDLRGYGKTEDKLIDATRGFGDQTDDIIGLMDHLGIKKFHVAGHSMGGGVIYMLLGHHSSRILSATLADPVSPYGFGGTRGLDGEPVTEDFAGTGAGVVNPEFARRISINDRTEEDPNASPRVVMNSFYWKPPFRAANEEELLDGLLEEKIGDKKYPGDAVESENWPGTAPGKFGPVNAASPKYVQGLAQDVINAPVKPPVLWVRGSDDQIVSNESLFDIATLGKLGLVPGYPGEDICPPQPMVDQTRYVLEQYRKNGGSFEEEVIEETGHSPFIEKPEEFMIHFKRNLSHA